MKIKSPLPLKFDFTCPPRFIASLGMDKEKGYETDLNFFPGRAIFVDECKPFGANWLVIFCVACALSNFFDTFNNFDYFATGRKYRSQREGMREGLKFLFAQGVPENVRDLNTVLGDKLEAATIDIMAQLLAFEKKEQLEHGNLPVPAEPVKVEPIPEPEPVKSPKTPVKKESGARAPWKNTILKIAGILGGLGFVASLFLPGWAKQALDLIVKLLELFGQ